MPVIREVEFHCELGSDAFLVAQVSGRERISAPYAYRVELRRDRTGDAKPVTAEQLLGTQACVRMDLSNGLKRHFHGYVVGFEKSGVDGSFDVYHVDLRPKLWYLRLGADCRVFQNQSALDIIDSVLQDYSVTVQKRVKAGLCTKRAFCVQYRESDFAFISRLMEDEGLSYHFKHEKTRHTMVICDSSAKRDTLPDSELLWAEEALDETVRIDVITSWRRNHVVRSLQFSHTDYDYLSPQADLATSASRTTSYPNPSSLIVRDYPGEYDDLAFDGKTKSITDRGTHLAELRRDVFTANEDVASAATPYRGVQAGYTFSLSKHPDAGSYLVTQVEFSGRFGGFEASQGEENRGFSARFKAVPAGVAFVPDAQTPRPVISGPQTAVVVGGDGDEILTDEYGRVKVQFRWDAVGQRNASSSCWIRVSHPWAGKNFGHIALPRVGEEVVVEFLEGNPDRPLITGRVYNAVNKPPYPLPDHATISGIRTHSSKDGGADDFNELRFEDNKGSEYIWLQAQKDFHRWVKNDSFDTVKNNRWSEVLKNTYDKVGQNYTLNVGQQATVKFGGKAQLHAGADVDAKVDGALNLTVAQAVALKAQAAVAVSVGSGLDLKAGSQINIGAGAKLSIQANGGVVIDGVTTLTLKAGSGSIVLGPAGVNITGLMVKINSGGSAASATAAQQANPAQPQDPPDPEQNQDPLAKSSS